MLGAALVASAGANLAGGLIQSGMNYHMQKKMLKWQKRQQMINWWREDNAVTRRSLDLERAGLSKTLAAGGAAQTGPVVKTEAPQLKGIPEAVQGAAANLMMMNTVAKTRAEIGAIEQQAKKAGAEASLAFQKKRLAEHDAQLMQGKPFLYQNPSSIGKSLRDAFNLGEGAKQKIFSDPKHPGYNKMTREQSINYNRILKAQGKAQAERYRKIVTHKRR